MSHLLSFHVRIAFQAVICAVCACAFSLAADEVSSLKKPERFVGMHFFNPAPLMPLVEIIPAIQTSDDIIKKTLTLSESWKKTTVLGCPSL